MNKCLLLLKVQLLGMFGINRARFSKDKKEKGRTALFAGVAALIGIMMLGYSFSIAISFTAFGMGHIIAPAIALTCSLLAFVFTFLKSRGVLFDFKDYDMMMSLPVNSGMVIASRLLSVYLPDAAFTLIISAPALFLYGLTEKLPFSSWLMMLLSILLIPILPIIAAMALGAFLTFVTVRLRHSNFFVIILNVVVFLGLMIFLMRFSVMSETEIIKALNQVSQMIGRIYPPGTMLGLALEQGDWLIFGKFAAVSLIPAVIFVVLLGRVYTKINSAIFAKRASKNYELGVLKQSAPVWALTRKEILCLLSSPVYFMNTLSGVLLLIPASITVFFLNISGIEQILGVSNIEGYIVNCIPFAICFFLVLGSPTAVSMNMEGKYRWLPFSLPVKPIIIFQAKILTNLLFSLPVSILGSLLFVIRFRITGVMLVCTFLVPVFYNIFTAVLGIVINFKLPKYDWSSEYQAVKNSASLIIVTIIGMVAVLLPFAGAVFAGEFIGILYGAVMGIIGLVTGILYHSLKSAVLYY